MTFCEQHVTFRWKIEPKPGGGFIAPSEKPADTIEGPRARKRKPARKSPRSSDPKWRHSAVWKALQLAGVVILICLLTQL